jgi:hypothetical protein
MRTALETRLNKLAFNLGLDVQRLRRQVAFDRLLCRLFAGPDPPWLLKGGYAMELRMQSARTTRDIDLGLKHFPTNAEFRPRCRISGGMSAHLSPVGSNW